MSWRDRVKTEHAEGVTPDGQLVATPTAPSPPASIDPDARLHATQARAKALNTPKPISELESLILGLTKGATLSQGNEIGRLLGTNPQDQKLASEHYVRAGRDNPIIFSLAEMAGRAPYALGSGAASALLAGAAGAVDAFGRSTDKANAIGDAALEGLAGAVLSGPGLSIAKSLAGKVTAPARKMSAGVARTFADIVDPAERAAAIAAQEAPAASVAPAAAKAASSTSSASAASRPILKAPSFLEGDMGMESIPRLAPGSEYTANIPGRREFFMEQIADPNSALAPRFVDKLAKTPGGIDALIEGPSSSTARDAVKALKAKLEPGVQEASTAALNATQPLEQVVNTVASSADNATKAAAAHKRAMMRSREYADAYKNAK